MSFTAVCLSIQVMHRLWMSSCHEAFSSTDCSIAALTDLLEASSQFAWGPSRVQEQLADMQAQLQEASAWLSQVRHGLHARHCRLYAPSDKELDPS